MEKIEERSIYLWAHYGVFCLIAQPQTCRCIDDFKKATSFSTLITLYLHLKDRSCPVSARLGHLLLSARFHVTSSSPGRDSQHHHLT